MNEDRALALARRQQQLLARSAQLRGQVAENLVPWQETLGWVDRTRAALHQGWQWLRRHPEVPAGIAVGVAVLRPRRAWAFGWRWGRRAWLGWQLFRRFGGTAPQPWQQAAASPAASLARMVIELTRR